MNYHWCLFGVEEDKSLYPLYYSDGRFWRGGSAILACYPSYQKAMGECRKAKKDLMSFENIIMRKVSFEMKD